MIWEICVTIYLQLDRKPFNFVNLSYFTDYSKQYYYSRYEQECDSNFLTCFGNYFDYDEKILPKLYFQFDFCQNMRAMLIISFFGCKYHCICPFRENFYSYQSCITYEFHYLHYQLHFATTFVILLNVGFSCILNSFLTALITRRVAFILAPFAPLHIPLFIDNEYFLFTD